MTPEVAAKLKEYRERKGAMRRKERKNQWIEHAFNPPALEWRRENRNWLNEMRSEGPAYYKHHPIPPQGYLEWGRGPTALSRGKKFRPRRFVEHYDPVTAQVYLVRPASKAKARVSGRQGRSKTGKRASQK